MESKSFSRKKIAIRFLYTIFYLFVFEIIKLIIQGLFVFQYVYLFITKKYSNHIIDFSSKLSVYTYKILRYISLIENDKPFPFKNFPKEIEKRDIEVLF